MPCTFYSLDFSIFRNLPSIKPMILLHMGNLSWLTESNFPGFLKAAPNVGRTNDSIFFRIIKDKLMSSTNILKYHKNIRTLEPMVY